MNLALQKADILQGLSPALVAELQQLLARVQVVFQREHNPQTGAHGDISVTGLTFGGTTQTTVGAAGGASALPATPSGYLQFVIGTTTYVLPFYAAS